MKMTIGRKLGAGFTFLLAMFIVVGIIVYTLNARVIKDALEVSQDDVPSVILSLSLLDKLDDMDVNVLKYMTGKVEEPADFEANRRAFLTSFEELAQIETKPEEVKMRLKIESLFSEYANTTDKQIFNRYDPKVEQWAKKQADSVVHQYGAALKKRLKELTKAALKETRLTTTSRETAAQPEVHIYLVLMDKAGELEINLTKYVAGITKEKQEFASNAAEFETFFNKLKALKNKQAEIATLNEILSLYTQLKKGAEEIFRRYNPETKKEALATLYRLEQEYFGQLEQILDSLAAEKKQDALTATRDITLIVTEMTYTMMAVILLAIIAGLAVSIFLARSITEPLALIVRGSNLLVAGDVALTDIDKREIDKITRRQDEMGDIGRAFEAQANYFKAVIEDIVQVSIELAKGNLRVTPQAEYRGDFAQIKKALETSLSNQRQVIEDIVRVSQGLAEGNLRVMPKAEYQGDFAQIKQAMEVALPALQQVIKDIVRVSQGLATGNLSVMPLGEYRGDIAQIKNALDKALPHQQQVIEDIIQVSQGLAKGNLHVTPQIEYRGDFVQIKNALETALSALRQVIEDIVQVSQGLAEGNLNITHQAEYRGDFIQIKHALVTAALKLSNATAQNAQQDWLKTGQTQLNDQIRGDHDIVALAKNIISFLTTYVEAQVGLFYLLQESKHRDSRPYLQVIATYAYTANDNIPNEFLLGEGLVGQAALEQKTLTRTHTPEEYTHIIQSGLAKAVPHHVLITPFLYEKTVKGVIELGSSTTLTDIQREFIEQSMPSLGIAVNTAQSR
ncbi:MAG TPA: HAMP domain-containing protein, partial [Thioploca sp.]|nr:HAMP domain-containing protein [Thioploca sp.]